MSWPEDVGILALEVYIPKTYVAHDELEVFDGASTGLKCTYINIIHCTLYMVYIVHSIHSTQYTYYIVHKHTDVLNTTNNPGASCVYFSFYLIL